MNLSDIQKKLIKQLLLDEIKLDDIPSITREALIKKGAVLEATGMPTEESFEPAGIPTYQQAIMELTSYIVYHGSRSVTLEKGTKVLVTFGWKSGKRKIVEGFVNMGDELLAVRLYRPPAAKWYEITMPDISKIKNEASDG